MLHNIIKMYNEVKHNEVKHNEVKHNEVMDKALADKQLADKALVEQYIAQLTPSEKIVFAIAQKQLESSFCIEKSIGFLQYLKNLSS